MLENSNTNENTYNNGTREYERLCEEKMDGFKTYISIVAAIIALQCSDLLKQEGLFCFILPFLVLVLTIIFLLMTNRTETFLRNTRERLKAYESKEGTNNKWYTDEEKWRNEKNEKKFLGFIKVSLYQTIMCTYIVLCIISMAIGIMRYLA